MVKAVFIIAQEGFRDEELFEPKQVLEAGGVECAVAAPTLLEAIGKLGGKVIPDLAIKQIDVSVYDVVIVVGGPGAPTLMDWPEVPKLLRNVVAQQKTLASICISPAAVLARSGVIEGKKATVWKGEFEGMKTSEFLEQVGKAHFVDEPVVVDGNLITANGPAAAKAFGKEILNHLQD